MNQQNRIGRAVGSIALRLVMAIAMLGGLVIAGPSVMPAQATVTPVTITLHVVFASQTGAPTSSFYSRSNLDQMVQDASDYWSKQTNGAIKQIRYDWNAIPTITYSPQDDVLMKSDQAVASQFPGVAPDLLSFYLTNNHNGDVVLAMVPPAEYEAKHPGTSGITFPIPGCVGYDRVCGEILMPGADGYGYLLRAGDSLAHELGHVFGLAHDSLVECPAGAPDPGANWQSVCSSYEYGLTSRYRVTTRSWVPEWVPDY
jgi:hypothetical protein